MPRGALWFGLAGGPLGWSLQLLASYAIAARACFDAGMPLREPATERLIPWLVIISVGGVVIAAMALITVLRQRHTDTDVPLDTRARQRFMAHAGIVISTVFVVATALHTVSLLIVGPC